jgi:biopolymer transport protein TolR
MQDPTDMNSGEDGPAPLSAINVTPLVDVMLVLLIVFMVAAPLMATGMTVNLPKAASKPIENKRPPQVVSVDKDGKIFIERETIDLESLVEILKMRLEGRTDEPILVKGDKDVPYGKVIEVVGVIGASGVGKVSLLTEQPKKKP